MLRCESPDELKNWLDAVNTTVLFEKEESLFMERRGGFGGVGVCPLSPSPNPSAESQGSFESQASVDSVAGNSVPALIPAAREVSDLPRPIVIPARRQYQKPEGVPVIPRFNSASPAPSSPVSYRTASLDSERMMGQLPFVPPRRSSLSACMTASNGRQESSVAPRANSIPNGRIVENNIFDPSKAKPEPAEDSKPMVRAESGGKEKKKGLFAWFRKG
ncbi:hypothetical protein HDU98_004602 [Podochytrium sp. JEL0797]|nr:hypothetical protein HDU98_004602 [Podochytrium sp. JEL0797]